MIKLVRVILSATVDPFVGEIKRALGTFTSLTSGIATGARSVVGFLGDIGNIVSGLKHGFDMLMGAARGLWDTFIQGAIDEERLGLTMKFLSGSAETSAGIMERLDDWVVKTATDGNEAEEAILDMAKALRSTDGSVDPDKLFRTMDILKRLSLVTGMGVAEMSKIVGRAMTGDVEMLARTLGISKEALAKLSPEFAKFMETAQGAQETQLGEVTRIGGEAETVAGDALKALDEITNALGAGQEAISEYASTAGGEVETLQGIWENFTEDIGNELLPVIQEALGKLIVFITDHKEDIDKFVGAFGDLAEQGFEKLMQFLDSGEAEKLFAALGNFSAEQWKNFADAISSVKWEDVANAVNGVTDFVNFLSGNKNPVPEEERAIDMGIIGSISKPEYAPENMNGFSWENFWSTAAKGLGLSGKQEIEVKVSIDDEMRLRAVYDKSTDEKLDDLVSGVTGGNNKVAKN